MPELENPYKYAQHSFYAEYHSWELNNKKLVPHKKTNPIWGKREIICCSLISENEELFNLAKQSKLYHLGQKECYLCGLKVTHVAKYRQFGESHGGFHIDLFNVTENKAIMMTQDHILPISHGGSNKLSNLKLCCSDCNNKRGNYVNDKEFFNIINNLDNHLGESYASQEKFKILLLNKNDEFKKYFIGTVKDMI